LRVNVRYENKSKSIFGGKVNTEKNSFVSWF